MSDPIVIIEPSDIDTIVILQENSSITIPMSGGVIVDEIILPSDISSIQVKPIVPDNIIVVPMVDSLYMESFETVSKNIKSWNNVIVYLLGNVSTITYTETTFTIIKTFHYTGNVLNSIVLSGSVPNNIDLIKSFGYTDGKLTSVMYF